MFDGKIDFMDFNKIKINYGGKLTCRKIFKKKYIIFLILSAILLIVLISLYTVKNNKELSFTLEKSENIFDIFCKNKKPRQIFKALDENDFKNKTPQEIITQIFD